jgi:uracil-DNA glycosylase
MIMVAAGAEGFFTTRIRYLPSLQYRDVSTPEGPAWGAGAFVSPSCRPPWLPQWSMAASRPIAPKLPTDSIDPARRSGGSAQRSGKDSKRSRPDGHHTWVSQLEVLANEIAQCRACPRLVRWREDVAEAKRASFRDDTYWGRGVPGFGDPMARLLVLGLAPAAHGANRTGRVFTGDRSGDWLFRAMHRAGFANQATSTAVDDGLTLHQAYVAAAVRCAPPDNSPSPEERDQCLPFLQRELTLLEGLRVIVVLGQFAYDVACRELAIRPKPKFGHGVEVLVPQQQLTKASTIICSFHPSQQNTFTGRLTEQMLDDVFAQARACCESR